MATTYRLTMPPTLQRETRFFGLLMLMGLCLLLARCSAPAPVAKRAAAATTYSGMKADCLAEAKASMPDRSEASKVAARARYDACRDAVEALWAPADAGAEGGAQ